jgi:hypothetical protein
MAENDPIVREAFEDDAIQNIFNYLSLCLKLLDNIEKRLELEDSELYTSLNTSHGLH